jgi:hypothetical protein
MWIGITCSLISISTATQNRSQSLLYIKMPLKSHSVAKYFGLTRPSSGSCSQIETTRQSIQGTRGQLMRTTYKGGTTWTPQNENNAEQRVNEDMQ